MSDIYRTVFLAFVRVHLLYHASEGPICGVEMIQELARHGYELSPGTLYPIFHELVAAGFLACEQRTVNGKVRKYYRITPTGQDALARLRLKIHELVSEVLSQKPDGAASVGPACTEKLG